MLRIHKPNKYKLLIIPITSILSIGVLLGLTYYPNFAHAEDVVTHPVENHPNLSDITYMQDMTQMICINSKVNKQYQLIDKRDSKTYWVARLQDGNCWMTQNLALDLDVDTKLTKTLTDVYSEWVPPSSTQYDTITDYPDGIKTFYSYNLGEYTYALSTETISCGNNANINKLSGCPGWQKVSGLSTNLTGDERAHYLVGNYYSFNAATAGSMPATVTSSGGVALYSICPKEWRLPNRARLENLPRLAPNNANILNGQILYPQYFVYSGLIAKNPYGLQWAGAYGNLWSSSVTKSTNNEIVSSYLEFGGKSGTKQIYADGTGRAMPVRCFANGGALNQNISIIVNSTISLDVLEEVKVEKGENNPSTANLDVKVSSNQPYNVSISSNDPVFRSSTSNATIPSKPGLLNTNENGWGIKLNTSPTYFQITPTPTTFYTASGAEVKTIPFTIGVSTSPDLPNGEYSTDITVTAVQN